MHDCKNPIASLDVNGAATGGTLADGDTAIDYYKFTGKKGQRITAYTRAQGLVMGNTGDDSTIIDTVLTIYDATGTKQLAQDDDSWPRFGRDSQLFTVIPEDGDYCITVTNCNTALGDTNCGMVSDLTTFDYEVTIADVDKLVAPEVNEGMEPNDDAAKAASVGYKLPMGANKGDYGTYILDGSFASDMDVDVFALDVPADVNFDANQRPHAEFWVQPITEKNGTGATSNAKLWVVSDADLTKHIAEVDQVNYTDGDNPNNEPIDMSVPVSAGKKYYLFVQHSSGASKPATDYYFIEHFVGSFYFGQLEKSPDMNDTAATAETLTTPMKVTAGNFFVDGDITTPADVDFYTMDVPSGSTKASLFCDAQRSGSGLRGAKFSLLKTDGTALGAGNVLSEVANANVYLAGQTAVAIPAGTTKVLLKVEAGSQDANVVGTYYHCSVGLSKM
jgi:hypothetical protein